MAGELSGFRRSSAAYLCVGGGGGDSGVTGLWNWEAVVELTRDYFCGKMDRAHLFLDATLDRSPKHSYPGRLVPCALILHSGSIADVNSSESCGQAGHNESI